MSRKAIMKHRNEKLKLKSHALAAPCVFTCLLVILLAELTANAHGVLSRVGYVFFLEPFHTAAGESAAMGKLVFCAWLCVAALILKARQEKRAARSALLLLLPAAAVAGFNACFDAGSAAPMVEPAAVIALIGVLVYELALLCQWSRAGLSLAAFAVCSAYAMHTPLGLWGAMVAATAMLVVELIWSSCEMNLLDSTIVLQDRK